jgi:HEAT repeat protein
MRANDRFFLRHIISFVGLFIITVPGQADQDNTLKTIQAHLTIKDYGSASDLAAAFLQKNPVDQSRWEAYIKTLAKKKDEKAMLSTWNAYLLRFGQKNISSKTLEEVAWGVIEIQTQSSSPLIRALSVLTALFAQDVRGIEILKKSLHDPNTFVRALAAELAGNLHDDQICDEMMECLNTEEFWKARLEIIKSLGKMEIAESRPILLKMIGSTQSSSEEKAAAAEALVSLLEKVDRQTVWELTQSDRAGLRYLSCVLVSHFDLKDELDLIVPLCKDPRSEVRAAALETIGLLRASHIDVKSLLSDPDPLVATYAAWIQTIKDPPKGQAIFKERLNHPSKDERLLACAGLAACGKYGMPLINDVFKQTSDPYIKMNLALALIRQQIEPVVASDALYHGFIQSKERWMWEEKGIFKYLAPSTLKHIDEIPQYPEAVNQLTRLEILNVLAILRHPFAQNAIKTFVLEKKWGLTGISAALLLTEGDDSALDLVQNLLKDPDPKVRFQSALILATWGKGIEALSTLEEAYAESDRDTKEKILEGICKVGSPASLPFLIERLNEPYPSLRLIAAAGILICLNN